MLKLNIDTRSTDDVIMQTQGTDSKFGHVKSRFQNLWDWKVDNVEVDFLLTCQTLELEKKITVLNMHVFSLLSFLPHEVVCQTVHAFVELKHSQFDLPLQPLCGFLVFRSITVINVDFPSLSLSTLKVTLISTDWNHTISSNSPHKKIICRVFNHIYATANALSYLT